MIDDNLDAFAGQLLISLPPISPEIRIDVLRLVVEISVL